MGVIKCEVHDRQGLQFLSPLLRAGFETRDPLGPPRIITLTLSMDGEIWMTPLVDEAFARSRGLDASLDTVALSFDDDDGEADFAQLTDGILPVCPRCWDDYVRSV